MAMFYILVLAPVAMTTTKSKPCPSNKPIHDSRGCVALLCQHPEEECPLLIGLGGGRDDDVATRWKGATKNNLPT